MTPHLTKYSFNIFCFPVETLFCAKPGVGVGHKDELSCRLGGKGLVTEPMRHDFKNGFSFLVLTREGSGGASQSRAALGS